MTSFLRNFAVALSAAFGLTACSLGGGTLSKPVRVGEEIKPIWTAPIASVTQPLVSDGTLFLAGFTAGKPDSEYKTYALDAATGKERWSRTSSDARILAVSGGKLFTLDFNKKVHVADPKTGAETSGFDVSEMTDDFVSFENDVFVISGIEKFLVTEKTTVTAVDAATGKKRWSTPLPQLGPRQNATLIGANDSVVLLKTQRLDGTATRTVIVGYDRSTGKQLWTFDRNDSVKLSRIEKDAVYLVVSELTTIAEGSGKATFAVDSLYSLDLKTGAVRWTASPCSQAIAMQEGVLIAAATGKDAKGKTLYAFLGLDVLSGKEIWRAEGVLGPYCREGHIPVGSLVWTSYRETRPDFRKVYDGDRSGSKVQAGFPNSISYSSLVGIDYRGQKIVRQSEVFPATDCSAIAESKGIVFVCTLSEMKEGRSGVWAYKPAN
jgi:outer membrane protein assembly factor BamB